MTRYDDCLVALNIAEGGFSNNPADTGGATNHGVTQLTYDNYRARKGLPQQPVQFMTEPEESDIYFSEYWTPPQCGSLPVPVDLVVFEMAVNAGPGRAAKLLQGALGVTQDGAIGPATLAAVGSQDPMALANAYLDACQRYYQQIVANNPSQSIFLNGWTNRVKNLRAAIAS